MAQDNITITLPESGLTAVMKGYIPHKASRRINSIFLGKQKINAQDIADSKQKGEDAGKKILAEVVLEGDDLVRYYDVLVDALLIQLGEHYAADGPLTDYIDDLPQEDFEKLRDVAVKVNNDHMEKANPKELPGGNPTMSEN